LNLAELAKLRWIEGWSPKQLADHYQKTPVSIYNHCRKIKNKNFIVDGLTKVEREKIRWTYKN
jgi:hypothetical protein